MEIEVDGERFSVVERPPNTYDVTWLSGPNPGYGFSVSGPPLDAEQIDDVIREFLADVDPTTGYLE
ncbi:hypothetical protein [Cellulomonas sp. URHD0024]|uniref:hypothetical protein n=1 Tax=Cellulomonas sp. URHD0024 TaxID=1302620 RepID=UPI00040BCF8F|nr:hypothetical protein [Cellulomonas sp. URHD0024]